MGLSVLTACRHSELRFFSLLALVRVLNVTLNPRKDFPELDHYFFGIDGTSHFFLVLGSTLHLRA